MTLRGQNRLRALPAIRRARGYHLYDNSGRRFLDLYLEGGRAWMGHRPEGLSLHLKNTLSRGVYSPYPGSGEGKLKKAAAALARQAGCTGEFEVLYFRDTNPDIPVPPASDPLWKDEGECRLWRPGLSWPDQADSVEILVPLPGFDAGRVIVTGKKDLPPGDLPSPVVAAALTRCLWSLKHILETQPAVSEVKTGSSWERKGFYLIFRGSEEEYDILFSKALSEGILLPPDTTDPMIIPLELTSGDLKILTSFLEAF